MTSETAVGVVVGAVVGVTASVLANKVVKELNELIRKDELEEAETEGYKRGYAAASLSPTNIRRCYEKMFGPKEGGGDS